MAKDKDVEKSPKQKRGKVLGPATIARPALLGAAVLAVVKVATKS